jgi:hypothetical protein
MGSRYVETPPKEEPKEETPTYGTEVLVTIFVLCMHMYLAS